MANNLPSVRIPDVDRVPVALPISEGWFLLGWNPGNDKTYRIEFLEMPFSLKTDTFRVIARSGFAAEVGLKYLKAGRYSRITKRTGTRPTSDVVTMELGGNKVGLSVEIYPDVVAGGVTIPGEVRVVQYNPATDGISEIVGGGSGSGESFRYVSHSEFLLNWTDEQLKVGRFSVIQDRTGTRPTSRVLVMELGQRQFAFSLELAAETGDGFGGVVPGVITAVTYNPANDTISPMPGQLSAELVAALEAADTPSITNPFITNAALIAAINALVDGAPGALDTLKEIAAQLAQDGTGAAAMLATIQQHTNQIATLQSNAQGGVQQRTGNVIAFDADAEYALLPNGAFTLDTSVIKVGVEVYAYTGPAAEQISIPAGLFVKDGGGHKPGVANQYAFKVSADGKIHYVVIPY